jgi:hypothetical protein
LRSNKLKLKIRMLDGKIENINFWNDVLLIIVLYKENLFNTLTFKSISEASNKSNLLLDLFVYDYSPNPNRFNSTDVRYNNFNILYFSDKDNKGLSVAYNRGIEYGRKKEKKFVLMLDQDTVFSENIFSDYERAVHEFPYINIFAPILLIENDKIFSPCVYKLKRGWHPKKISTGVNYLFKFVPVNSGVMLSMNVFNRVGLYNENLRVDFIDFQFMEKVRKFYKTFCVVGTIGRQSFSANTYDLESELTRFKIFLCDIGNIDKKNIFDSITWFLNIIVRIGKLTIKYQRFDFVKFYFISIKLK